MRGGARKGSGRKPGPVSPDPRIVVRQIRWTAAEWAEVEKGAEEAGKSVADYQRGRVLRISKP